MKIFLLLLMVVINHALPHQRNWQQFKVQHRKNYLSPDEEQERMNIFFRHQRYIEEHNKKYQKGLVSHSLRMNHFGDMSEKEFSSIFKTKVSYPKALYSEALLNETLPDEIDWRESGAVTAVKDQGTCNACWAYSATGAIEGRLFLKTKKLVPLSEQQLLDCSQNNDGCMGGEATEAYEYLKYVDGIESEDAYPYRAMAGNCSSSRGAEVAGISGYLTLRPGDEAALQRALASGPVSVSVDSTPVDFMFYYKGLFTGCSIRWIAALLPTTWGCWSSATVKRKVKSSGW